MRLKDMTAPPPNYRSTIALAIPAAEYVIFPGTRGVIAKLTNASDPDIQAKTTELFDKHGLGQRPTLCP
jgi:hypothetical protein